MEGNTDEHIPDTSWLHGKWEWEDIRLEKDRRDSKGRITKGDRDDTNSYRYVINTKLPYVSIGILGDTFFCQGEEADDVIAEIHKIWLNGNCSVLSATKKWEKLML